MKNHTGQYFRFSCSPANLPAKQHKTISLVSVWIAVIFLCLSGCGGNDRPAFGVSFQGTASVFTDTGVAYGDCYIVESTSFVTNGVIENFFHGSNNGGMAYGTGNPLSIENVQSTDIGLIYFMNVIRYQDAYYVFGSVDLDNKVYLWKSTDRLRWSLINGGNPVLELSSDPTSIWHTRIWNTTVAIDEAGKWTFLVEIYNSQYFYSVGYAYGYLDGENLTLNKSEHAAIENGGCPDVHYIPGRGYLAFYMVATDEQNAYLGAAISEDGLNWKVSSSFKISQDTQVIADPTAYELDGKLYLMYSWNQDRVRQAVANITFKGLYDLIDIEAERFHHTLYGVDPSW